MLQRQPRKKKSLEKSILNIFIYIVFASSMDFNKKFIKQKTQKFIRIQLIFFQWTKQNIICQFLN